MISVGQWDINWEKPHQLGRMRLLSHDLSGPVGYQLGQTTREQKHSKGSCHIANQTFESSDGQKSSAAA